ncbi:MAG TPA: aminopeptidase P family N-terminal domain-containing protein, partial [Stellaceae bacterium]|nr:aminopeptidase P family N-terminal domain-containing protein [Stellaceae bacterium]
MDESGPDPDGDAALARLLAASGSRYDPQGVRALVSGVLAAGPDPVEPDRWMTLVAPDPSPQLRAALRTLAAALSGGPPADVPPAPDRLRALREELARRGVDGFLVPRADQHLMEYVPACSQRLGWLTGFTGSAGLAAVLKDKAALFVDGRYTLQAQAQADPSLYAVQPIGPRGAADWIAAHLGRGAVLGYDPWLHTPGEVDRYRGALERAGGELRALDSNPIDAVWRGRPPAPLAPVVPQPLRFAGKSSADKRREVAAKLADEGADAAVLTLPDSIAWLLNIRGGDVTYS